MKNEHWYKVARQIITYDEGLRLRPYKDSLGLWTYGVGRLIGPNLEDLTISKATATQMLDEDIGEAWCSMVVMFGEETINSWAPARQHAILSLIFNLGMSRFAGFKKAIDAVLKQNWDKAAFEFNDSAWAKQVGEGRSSRICQMIKTGGYHEEYKV